MSEEGPPKEEEPPIETPGEKPGSVLDSIFRDGGPMPPARLWLRSLAFLLDFILLTALASVIIWKIALPQSYPGAWLELQEFSQAFLEWMSSDRQEPAPEPSPQLIRALNFANEIQILVFWIYFALGEAFFSGSTLGKRACKLRTVSTVTLTPPNVLTGIVRGGVKTVAIFFIFPFALVATLLAGLFNKRRQLGHDLLSRTAVVDEKNVNIAAQS